ncbi:FAS1-like dehydratase domain-containing protein [Hamadaea tsunoensis]|uniref:FAS1-like dehydratase domain-containing protein n=1 Tax=Hamadaea tsunoensis TaxID=53368 RepID=UPI00041819BD|nr:MaoC family dehydratase N-terminal domain-containing protein [Hamadaea tsunoensis]
MKLLTEELRAEIGRELVYTAPEELGAASIRYFALAVGSTRPEYAGPDPIAPPTLICETNQYAGRTPDADGYAGHGWDLDVPGTRLVRGGNRYEFHQPARASDVLTVTWRLSGMDERVTGAGQAMLVVTSTATYRNQHGDLLAVNTETLLYVAVAA